MREEQRNQKTGTARTPRENRPSAMVQGRKPVQQKQTAVEQSPKSSPEPQGLVARGRQKLQVMSSRADERWEEKGNALVRTRGSMDRTMLSLILILLALGSIMVFSASYPSALAQKGNSLYYITRHMFFVITGVVAMLAISKFPLWVFEDYAPVAFGIAVFLLIFVLIPTPFSVARGEARRWLIFGSITVQPSEIMKAALILMLARYLGKHQQDMVKGTRSWGCFFVRSTVLPGLFLGFACILVLAENHLSGMLIMGMIGAVVLFMGGVPWFFLLAVALTLGGAAVVLFVTTQDYALERLTSFFDKENVDILDEGWQTAQGQYAIGSGGFLGTGLGGSRQKYSYVSEPQNDFIFTIWCEEMGFVGAVAVIALFLLFLWRGIVIATRAPDTFSALAVLGIVGHVSIQAFLNIGVVTGALPNTGVSLPFFSYGGTSTLVLLMEMGVLLAVSRHLYIKK